MSITTTNIFNPLKSDQCGIRPEHHWLETYPTTKNLGSFIHIGFIIIDIILNLIKWIFIITLINFKLDCFPQAQIPCMGKWTWYISFSCFSNLENKIHFSLSIAMWMLRPWVKEHTVGDHDIKELTESSLVSQMDIIVGAYALAPCNTRHINDLEQDCLNSLIPRRFKWKFLQVIFKIILLIKGSFWNCP